MRLNAKLIVLTALLSAPLSANAGESWSDWASSKASKAWSATTESSAQAAEAGRKLASELGPSDLVAWADESWSALRLSQRGLELWQSAAAAWDGVDTSGWIPADMLPESWEKSLALPDGWELIAWVPDERVGPTVARLQSLATRAADQIPTEATWWRDFGVTTGVVGATVGTATFGCAVIATPGGPVLMALAGGACGTIAAHGGTVLVREGYAWAGEALDEGALRAGTITGSVLGSITGSMAISQYLQWQQFRHYKDFAGYAKEARSLTAKTLRTTPASVAQLRAGGYDIDHVIPVKCGWKFGIAAAEIASMSNLHALPSSINRSIGSKGC